MRYLLSIPLRISIPVLLLSCAAIASAIAWRRDVRLVAHEIEIQSVAAAGFRATRLQATLEYLFRKQDANGIQLEVSGMATYKDVVAVFVLDEGDHVIAATRYATIGRSAASITPDLPEDLKRQHASRIAEVRATRTGSVTLSRDQHTIVSYYPLLISVDEHTLRPVRRGLVILLMDMQAVKSRAFDAAGRQALQYVLLFSALAGCIWIFIHFSITRRVARLVAATRQFASGDLNVRAGIEGKDELALVAKSFDLMAARIGEDIRRREHVEEELRKSEQRNRSIVETANDAFITIDGGSVIKDWNPQAEAIFGWPRTEAIGRTLDETIIPHRLRKAHHRGMQRFLAAGARAFLNKRIELTAVHRDGREFPVEMTVWPLRVGGDLTFNAFVHDISERKRVETEVENLHRQLLKASRQAGMAEVATNVLHNVGNVLNSVNVSTNIVVQIARETKAAGLAAVAALVREHERDLGKFISEDARGKHLPKYLALLSDELSAEREATLREVESLRRNVEHIKEIVAMQQNYAHVSGVKEIVSIVELVEDCLRMNADSLVRHGVEVIRCFEEVARVNVDKHKVLQILVNIVRNASYACQECGRPDPRLVLRVAQAGHRIKLSVTDNGLGIAQENLTRIFAHGFTTRKNGHGFGLHSSALAAREMGGSLSVHSDGIGLGATFTLELPIQPAECVNA